MLKARKSLNFHTPPFFDGNLVMKFGTRKLESWGYQMVQVS